MLDTLHDIDKGEKHIVEIDKKFLSDLADSEIRDIILTTQLPENGVLSSKVLASTCVSLIPHAKLMQNMGPENHGWFAFQKAKLLSYFPSYSKLNIPTEFEPGEISNCDILATFEELVERKDLEGAARIMNQSKGEVRRIFSDWLDETRRYLEVKLFLETLRDLINVQLLNILS